MESASHLYFPPKTRKPVNYLVKKWIVFACTLVLEPITSRSPTTYNCGTKSHNLVRSPHGTHCLSWRNAGTDGIKVGWWMALPWTDHQTYQRCQYCGTCYATIVIVLYSLPPVFGCESSHSKPLGIRWDCWEQIQWFPTPRASWAIVCKQHEVQ